jgi:hypothetical protein
LEVMVAVEPATRTPGVVRVMPARPRTLAKAKDERPATTTKPRPGPDPAAIEAALNALTDAVDEPCSEQPVAGRTASRRRLQRSPETIVPGEHR